MSDADDEDDDIETLGGLAGLKTFKYFATCKHKRGTNVGASGTSTAAATSGKKCSIHFQLVSKKKGSHKNKTKPNN